MFECLVVRSLTQPCVVPRRLTADHENAKVLCGSNDRRRQHNEYGNPKGICAVTAYTKPRE